jgi:hypothetical protein
MVDVDQGCHSSVGHAPSKPERRGWLPVSGTIGNVLVVPLDPSLAWRLRERFGRDPYAPLEVAVRVDGALEDFVG